MVQTVQNEKDGKVAFAAIDYATPGDHDYTIKEVKGADSTVVYDAKGVKVHVKVTDEKGELKATVTYDGEKAVPTFTNTKPTADVTVEATKVLAGKDLTPMRSPSACTTRTAMRTLAAPTIRMARSS